jgi:P27 family predicted phage terminase small subunit
MVEPPADLTAPEREEWNSLAGLFDRPAFRGKVDLAALPDMCRAIVRSREAAAAVARDGLVDEAGRLHPMVQVQLRTAQEMLRLSDRLGMTPAARKRLGIVLDDPSDA